MKYKFFHLVISLRLNCTASAKISVISISPLCNSVTLFLSNLGVDDVEARGWGGEGCRSSVDTHYEGLLDGYRRKRDGSAESQYRPTDWTYLPEPARLRWHRVLSRPRTGWNSTHWWTRQWADP